MSTDPPSVPQRGDASLPVEKVSDLIFNAYILRFHTENAIMRLSLTKCSWNYFSTSLSWSLYQPPGCVHPKLATTVVKYSLKMSYLKMMWRSIVSVKPVVNTVSVALHPSSSWLFDVINGDNLLQSCDSAASTGLSPSPESASRKRVPPHFSPLSRRFVARWRTGGVRCCRGEWSQRENVLSPEAFS